MQLKFENDSGRLVQQSVVSSYLETHDVLASDVANNRSSRNVYHWSALDHRDLMLRYCPQVNWWLRRSRCTHIRIKGVYQSLGIAQAYNTAQQGMF